MNIIQYIKKKLNKSSFGKSIAIIFGGTAFAQGLNIVLSPIITRIYPPEQYGVLSAYTAILTILVISASLDYQKAIPIAEDDNKSINLLVLSVSILFTVTLILLLILVFWGDYFLNLINSQVLISYKYLIPIGIFAMGIYDIVLQWAYKDKNYKVITTTKISQSVTSNIIKVSLGIMKIGPVGLIIAAIVGQSSGLTSLSLPVVRKKKIFSNVSYKQMKYVFFRYKKFALYSAPSNYVYTAGNSLPVIFLAALFGNASAGFYGLSYSIIKLPLNLIGTSISQVFYSEAASIGRTNPSEIKRLSFKLVKKLATFSIVPFIGLFILAPFLFSFAFGSEWYQAGIYARLLSIMVYCHFIILPIGRVLEIFERQREGLILNVIRLVTILAIFFVSKIMNLSEYQTIGVYSIFGALTYITLLIMVKKILDIEIKNANKESCERVTK